MLSIIEIGGIDNTSFDWTLIIGNYPIISRLSSLTNVLLGEKNEPLEGIQSESFLVLEAPPPVPPVPAPMLGFGTSTSRRLVSEGGSSMSRVKSSLSSSPRNFLPRVGRRLLRLRALPGVPDGVAGFIDPGVAPPVGEGDRRRLMAAFFLCFGSPTPIISSTDSRSLCAVFFPAKFSNYHQLCTSNTIELHVTSVKDERNRFTINIHKYYFVLSYDSSTYF